MTKHTKDNWHAATANGILYVISGAPPSPDEDSPNHERRDRKVLARVYDSGDGAEWEPGEGEANMNLFAAAADMAALLSEIDEYLSPNPLNSIGTGSVLHNKIRAVLAKETKATATP